MNIFPNEKCRLLNKGEFFILELKKLNFILELKKLNFYIQAQCKEAILAENLDVEDLWNKVVCKKMSAQRLYPWRSSKNNDFFPVRCLNCRMKG